MATGTQDRRRLPDCAAAQVRRVRAPGTTGPGVRRPAAAVPCTVGTLRDPNNLGKQWRKVRDDLGVPEVTSHSFRKTIATLIDDEGLSARIGADQLGHSNVSMTQDRYMKRGGVHQQVADLMDRTVDINDE